MTFKVHYLSAMLAFSVVLRCHGQKRVSIHTGNDLKAFCAESTDESEASWLSYGMCAGFITGVAADEGFTHVELSMRHVKDLRELRACVPDEVENGQLLDIVKKSMQERPETLHLHAAVVVRGALHDAFPCEK